MTPADRPALTDNGTGPDPKYKVTGKTVNPESRRITAERAAKFDAMTAGQQMRYVMETTVNMIYCRAGEREMRKWKKRDPAGFMKKMLEMEAMELRAVEAGKALQGAGGTMTPARPDRHSCPAMSGEDLVRLIDNLIAEYKSGRRA